MKEEQIEKEIDSMIEKAYCFDSDSRYTLGVINGLIMAKNCLLIRNQEYKTLDEVKNAANTLQKGV
jgi:hypothetical protein